MRRVLVSLLLAAAITTASTASATAAPPAHGTPTPSTEAGDTIAADYVGPAMVGPRSRCTPKPTSDGGSVTLCVDVTRVYWRMWLRSGSAGWKPGNLISNLTSDYVLVLPYAKGWHWCVSLRYGIFALPTRALSVPNTTSS